jgi:hypothetical protein
MDVVFGSRNITLMFSSILEIHEGCPRVEE